MGATNECLFITGATGFIGRALVKRMRATRPERRIIALVRDRGRASGLSDEHVVYRPRSSSARTASTTTPPTAHPETVGLTLRQFPLLDVRRGERTTTRAHITNDVVQIKGFVCVV